MAKFMLLYRSTSDPMEMMANATPEQMQEGMKPWLDWFGKLGSAVVDGGNPLGNSATLAGNGGPTSPTQVAGYSIIEANDAADAKAKSNGHPHLMVPGNSIEILEVFPMM